MNPLQESGAVVTTAGRGRFSRLPEGREVLITLDSGQQFTVPGELLTRQPDGEHYLNLSLADLQARARSTPVASEEVVVPVVEETLSVGVRAVDKGRVRVTKTVREVNEQLETLLQRDEVDVERVPVNEYVDAASPVEYSDDRVVIPIYEEEVVVEKRLRLKEKLVITRRRVEQRDVQPATRRVEEAVVERLDPDKGRSGPG